jgi:hypothetical protein
LPKTAKKTIASKHVEICKKRRKLIKFPKELLRKSDMAIHSNERLCFFSIAARWFSTILTKLATSSCVAAL